jgi:hypothetical protein
MSAENLDNRGLTHGWFLNLHFSSYCRNTPAAAAAFSVAVEVAVSVAVDVPDG